jgi:site-specific DNA-methyltransferase (adenine-specific)
MARWSLHHGDCLEWLRTLPSASVDAVVTDPPAGITFMDKAWDHHRGGRAEWVAWLADVMRECLRVLKPGGHALVWSLPRTEHWTACAIEDAGFEIRDGVYHLFAQGWPKSLDVSKTIDAAAGAEREKVRTEYTGNALMRAGGQNTRPWMEAAREAGYHEHASKDPVTDDAKRWSGWGTALKPACERWVLARKPIAGTVAANVVAHGVGVLNIDGCRVESGASPSAARRASTARSGRGRSNGASGLADCTTLERFTEQRAGEVLGRWPSNVVLSHAETCGDECDEACPVRGLDEQTSDLRNTGVKTPSFGGGTRNAFGRTDRGRVIPLEIANRGDSGGASRFFPVFHPFGYFGKAKSTSQRGGKENRHPTVKNIDLMRWLVRLITPRGGLVLDAFGGSGTTGVAALLEGCSFVAAEADSESHAFACKRLAAAERGETIVRAETTEPRADEAQRALDLTVT